MSMTQISLDHATLAALDAVASARALTREETVREASMNSKKMDLYSAPLLMTFLSDLYF